MRRPSVFLIGYEDYTQAVNAIELLEGNGFAFDSSNIDFNNKFHYSKPDGYIQECNCIAVNASKKFWLLEEDYINEKLIAVNFLGDLSKEELFNLYNFYFGFFQYSRDVENNYYSNYVKIDRRFGVRYTILNKEDYKTVEDDFILIHKIEDKNQLEVISTKYVHEESRLFAPPTGFKYYNTYQVLTVGKICTILEDDEVFHEKSSAIRAEDGIYISDNNFAYCNDSRNIQVENIHDKISSHRETYMMDERGISYYDPFLYGLFLEFKLKF